MCQLQIHCCEHNINVSGFKRAVVQWLSFVYLPQQNTSHYMHGKGSSIKDVLAKTDILDPPLYNIVVWPTPHLPHLGRLDRIERKSVRNAKYIAIRKPVDGEGGVGLQYGLPKRQKKVLKAHFFVSGRPVDGRPPRPRTFTLADTPLPSFDRTSLLDGP